jgi:two-component system response regulator YesN
MSYNILLIDDDAMFREEIAEYLEDYAIIEASSGEEALALLRKPNEIDLVILDVRMPGIHGTKVLKEIKKMEPDLGVVIFTGFSTKDVAIEALKGHADDYLEKPADIGKIKDVVYSLLDSKAGAYGTGATGTRGRVERVRSLIERNYDKKVTLRDAAATVCMSPKYLSRVFKEITNKGFIEYRLEIMVEKGKELLGGTERTVAQIAYELGYQNTESFIRQFKKYTSLTPNQYRQHVLKKITGKAIPDGNNR